MHKIVGIGVMLSVFIMADIPTYSTSSLIESDGAPIAVDEGFASPCVTDWNEDGSWDMVVGDNSDNLHLFLGSGGTTNNDYTKTGTNDTYNLTVNQFHGATLLSIRFETYSQENIELKVYRSDGRFIYGRAMRSEVGFNRTQIPLHNLSKGMYLINISVGNKKINKKVTIF